MQLNAKSVLTVAAISLVVTLVVHVAAKQYDKSKTSAPASTATAGNAASAS